MKKTLIFLISFILVGLIAYAQTPEENFKKAGQAELAKRDAVLSQKKAAIEEFFYGMANDGVVSGKEMRTLRKMVKDFNETRSRFIDKELKFYGVITTVDFSPDVQGILNIYFEISREKDGDAGGANFRDNRKQEIRKYFTVRTGYDVRIERSKNWKSRIGVGIALGLFLGFVFGFLVFLNHSLKSAKITFSVIFVVILLIFILIP